MAGTAQTRLSSTPPQSAEHQALIELNRLITDVEVLRGVLYRMAMYGAIGNPGFAISTNFDVKNVNSISYRNGGTLKTLANNTNFDTGTTATIATTKWGAALLTVNSSGSGVVTWASGSQMTYADEATAIAALPAPAATDTVLGYVTVQAAGSTWTAGTDALQGGTGGTPATTTNYYNTVDANGQIFGTIDAAADLTAAQVKNLGGSVITT